MRIRLLEVPIDAISRVEARGRVEAMLVEPRGHLVTTPNSEMLVAAHSEPLFRKALQSANLAIPDGTGLVLVARLRGQRIPERITGTDFVDDLAAIAAQRGDSIFLLGGRGDVAKRAAAALVAAHPGLRIVGAESGGDVQFRDGAPRLDEAVEDRVIAAAPRLLLVAFGHGTQERWIAENVTGGTRSFPSVRLAIGVGGAFDFLAGDVRRAPAWMRAVGLEWLWRLILQPRRIGRILTAVFVFPWLALTHRD